MNDLADTRDIFSVSRLNNEVAAVLAGSFPLLWVQGEISNLARPRSGHLYFTLKDGHAQVRCALFRGKRALLRSPPGDGDEVLLRARIGFYAPRGEFQLIVEHLEPAGAGRLQQEFERLKAKLQAEGLFDPARKRPLPRFPRRLGVITSPSGAAIRDVLKVLGQRYPALRVLVFPAAVQGREAPGALRAALRLAAQRADCDLLLLTRGGGSAEDLAAFNDEPLAREIAACPIPVISAVGHEIDFTIADFVADRRAPTPSAAAELLSPDRHELARRVAQLRTRLVQRMSTLLVHGSRGLRNIERRLALLAPDTRIQQRQQRLDELEMRMQRALRSRMTNASARLAALQQRLGSAGPGHRLAHAGQRLAPLPARLRSAWHGQQRLRGVRLAAQAGRLNGINPLATLGRGYAIVDSAATGEILRDPSQVGAGDLIRARLAGGSIHARVCAEDDG